MIKFRRGSELIDIAKSYYHISTGSTRLDLLLYGGIRSSAVTEIHGLSGSGKTQLCLELILNAIIPNNDPTLNYSAVYISTRKCFFPERINEIIEQHKRKMFESAANPVDFNSRDILKRILYKQAFEYDELAFSIHYLKSQLSENRNNKNVRLIVIDSFSTHIKDLKGWDKIQKLYELMLTLITMAHEHNCAVLLTCDMTVRSDCNTNTKELIFEIQPALGVIFLDAVNQSIKLEKIDNVINVSQRKCLRGRPGRTTFIIDEDIGITDLAESNSSESTNSENSDSEEYEIAGTSNAT